MRAKDLAIKDWVLFNNKPRKIRGVLEEDGNFERVWFEGEKYPRVLIHELLHFVPLTEEVLGRNGFKKGSYVGGWLMGGLPFRVIVDEKTVFENFIPPFEDELVFYCSSVHELQHCLRLCGFSELADSFELE